MTTVRNGVKSLPIKGVPSLSHSSLLASQNSTADMVQVPHTCEKKRKNKKVINSRIACMRASIFPHTCTREKIWWVLITKVAPIVKKLFLCKKL